MNELLATIYPQKPERERERERERETAG